MASKNTRSRNTAPVSGAASTSRPADKCDANAVKSTVASGPATAPVKAPAAAAAVVAAPAASTAPAASAAPKSAAAVVTPAAVKTASAAAPVAEPVRDRSAIAGLVARLRDADAETARDAAATLGRLPVDSQAVAALAAVLINADGYYHSVVRAAAAAALGALGDRSAVEALLHATNDTMAEASEEAIKALGRLGDPRALPALELIVRNENGFFLEHVRRAAQESLRKIRGGHA